MRKDKWNKVYKTSQWRSLFLLACVNFCHKLWTSTGIHICLLISAPWTYGYLSFTTFSCLTSTPSHAKLDKCFPHTRLLLLPYLSGCTHTISSNWSISFVTTLPYLPFKTLPNPKYSISDDFLTSPKFLYCFPMTSLQNLTYNDFSISSFLLNFKLFEGKDYLLNTYFLKTAKYT